MDWNNLSKTDLRFLSLDDEDCLKAVHSFLSTLISTNTNELIDLLSKFELTQSQLKKKRRQIAKALLDNSEFKSGDKVKVTYQDKWNSPDELTATAFVKSVTFCNFHHQFDYTFLSVKKIEPVQNIHSLLLEIL